MNEELLKDLLDHIRCGFCSSSLETQDAQIMGSQDGMTFLQIVCPNCYAKALVMVIGNVPPAEPVETPITKEDQQEILNTIKDGNFKKLFGEK